MTAELQNNPYSPSLWSFIRDQVSEPPSQEKDAAGWLSKDQYGNRNLLPDWFVGKGGTVYDSDLDASSNLSGILGTAGSITGGTLGAVGGTAATAGNPVGTVAGGAAGSAAGGMAGRGAGDALGNSGFGKWLNSMTGNGGQNKIKTDPATWRDVAVDAAFGGVGGGLAPAYRGLRAFASPSYAAGRAAKEFVRRGTLQTAEQASAAAGKLMNGASPLRRAAIASRFSPPKLWQPGASAGAKALGLGAPLAANGALSAGLKTLGNLSGNAVADTGKPAGDLYSGLHSKLLGNTSGYTGLVGTANGGFGDKRNFG
jgi:hypothetical protein